MANDGGSYLTTPKLSNNDFRQILMTPRVDRSQTQSSTASEAPTPNSRSNSSSSSNYEKSKGGAASKTPSLHEQKRRKYMQNKLKREARGELDSERIENNNSRSSSSGQDKIAMPPPTPQSSSSKSSYRDRAKERRDGKETPVFGDDIAEFQLGGAIANLKDKKASVSEMDTSSNSSATAAGLTGGGTTSAANTKSAAMTAAAAAAAAANSIQYRMVAANLRDNLQLADQRRLAIENTKYLGGDINNTHKVKGLDYVLLESVKQGIAIKEKLVEKRQISASSSASSSAASSAANAANSNNNNNSASGVVVKPIKHEAFECRTRLALDTCRFALSGGCSLVSGNVEALASGTNRPQLRHMRRRNELFAQGRMAYRVDLEEDWAEFEVPATIIRSRSDCIVSKDAPAGAAKKNDATAIGSTSAATTTSAATPSTAVTNSDGITTNEIVVSKLIEIFAYLRNDRLQAKRNKAAAAAAARKRGANSSAPGITSSSAAAEPDNDVTAAKVSRKSGSVADKSAEEFVDIWKDFEDSDQSGSKKEARIYDSSAGNKSKSSLYFDRPEMQYESVNSGGSKRHVGNKKSSAASANSLLQQQQQQNSVDQAKLYMEKLIAQSGQQRIDGSREPTREEQEIESYLKKKFQTSGYDECYPINELDELPAGQISANITFSGKIVPKSSGGAGGAPPLTPHSGNKNSQSTNLSALASGSNASSLMLQFAKDANEGGGRRGAGGGGGEDEEDEDRPDFSKMDMGNKKGPIGRWDFETQEQYSEYMSNREAHPKAAFQYGVKMADGRKTRRLAGGRAGRAGGGGGSGGRAAGGGGGASAAASNASKKLEKQLKQITSLVNRFKKD